MFLKTAQSFYFEGLARTRRASPLQTCLRWSGWVRGNTADSPHSRRLRREVEASVKLSLILLQPLHGGKHTHTHTHTFGHMFDSSAIFAKNSSQETTRSTDRRGVFVWARSSALNDALRKLCSCSAGGRKKLFWCLFWFQISGSSAGWDTDEKCLVAPSCRLGG